MKNLLIVFGIVLGSHGLIAQNIAESDSIQIVSKIDDWNRAWEIKDVELACKWYSNNADFTNAFGFNRIGQLEIQKYLTEVFAFGFVMSGATEQTSLKLKQLSEKAILAITTVEREGQKAADNKNLGTRRTTHYRVFEKTEEWRITAHLVSDARSIDSEIH
ncbi:Cif family virulence factor [Algoriphagus chordae]|uniref:DUF4440 domain-containing protein n=1 Tax=Algoriphagus chordae TaxID=237019 RepID=A0A2W7QY01_9BACT|nr:hypothetical protein [Algoriphagus chordae]PZX51986.1 hypothetical protein LV85_02135 [Algoriphagus chordae]